MAKFFFFLLLTCTSGFAFAQDSWNLVGSDFQSRAITLQGIDLQAVRFTDATSAEPQQAKWDQLLELDHAQSTSPAVDKAAFALHLNGGDLIAGTPLAIADDKLTWQQTVLGEIQISEDRVNAIVRAGQTVAKLDEPRKEDTVQLLNGDRTTGVIGGLSNGLVTITPSGADSPAQINLDKIAAVLLADPDPRAAPSTRGFRVWLNDGSSLTVPAINLPAAASRLALSMSHNRTATVDLSAVTCIEQTNGPVRWLNSLPPTQVLYHPYLEENFPPRFDHPVDDPAISIRQKFPGFHHGIGVHSYTKLIYAIPDQTKTFRTQFTLERIGGVDMTKADVTVRIFLDANPVRQYPHVRYGSIADPIVLDVSGAKELALEVDYGDNLDAQDRFVWLDPAFIRAEPTTNPN